MSYNTPNDFYDIFDKHPEQFATATTWPEFCALVGGSLLEQLSTYRWVPAVFATAKAGKRTQRPLSIPTAARFEDIFESAIFAETTAQHPAGFYYLSGRSPDFASFVGGTRGWSKSDPNIRSHFGGKFFGIYLKLRPEFSEVTGGFGRHISFEAIKRTDGVLITCRDASYIGCTWVALLDSSATVEGLFDEKTKQFRREEKTAERLAWGSEVIKTYDEWSESGKDLDNYLQVGDYVDDAFASWAVNVLPPRTWSDSLVQIGEPASHIGGRATYATFRRLSGKPWQYVGDCHVGQWFPPKQ